MEYDIVWRANGIAKTGLTYGILNLKFASRNHRITRSQGRNEVA